LIGMCLDILIREGSHGKRSLMSLLKELSLKYGENKTFNDDDLIAEISQMTYPSVAEFFKLHVEGGTPIPYQEYFDKVGLTLSPNRQLKESENVTETQLTLRNAWLKSNYSQNKS